MRRRLAASMALVMCLALGGLPATAQSPPPLLLAPPSLVRYEDAEGDQSDGIGPDILAVTVSQPDPTKVTIALEFADAPPLGYDVGENYTDMLMVLFATDPEGLVLSPDGEWCDFFTWAHGYDLQETLERGMWLSACTAQPPGSGSAVAVALEGAALSLTLTRESLGDPQRILFLVGVGREGQTENSGGDDCPDNPEEGPLTLAAWTFPTE